MAVLHRIAALWGKSRGAKSAKRSPMAPRAGARTGALRASAKRANVVRTNAKASPQLGGAATEVDFAPAHAEVAAMHAAAHAMRAEVPAMRVAPGARGAADAKANAAAGRATVGSRAVVRADATPADGVATTSHAAKWARAARADADAVTTRHVIKRASAQGKDAAEGARAQAGARGVRDAIKRAAPAGKDAATSAARGDTSAVREVVKREALRRAGSHGKEAAAGFAEGTAVRDAQRIAAQGKAPAVARSGALRSTAFGARAGTLSTRPGAGSDGVRDGMSPRDHVLAWLRALRERSVKAWAAVRPARPAAAIDPTLPATAQIVAVQQPSAALPERPYDLLLLAAVLGLLCIGTIEIYSATAADGLTRFHDAGYFLERQIGFLAIGGGGMWIGARMDYRRLKQWTYPLLVGSLVMLVMTLGAPTLNGARRWIPLGPMTFQPVEIAKLALVTYLAYSLGRKADQVKTFTVGFVPHLVVCSLMMVVLLKQPDLGSSVVLGATTLGLLFMAGARISYIVLAVLAAAPIAYHMVVGTSWRLQRVLAYFNPEAYAQGDAYQYVQARLAMGSGGFTGAGLGGGHQTLGYTPEAHSDFILAPIGEELGWLGVALVLTLFGILVWRGIRAALGARDVFGGYLAFGITLLFGVQTLFNVGVVLGIVPNKGITLPLVSCGGSSLVITMFLVGLLFNVGRRPERTAREAPPRELARRKRMRVRVMV